MFGNREKVAFKRFAICRIFGYFSRKKMGKDTNSALLPHQSDVVALDTKTKH